MKAPLPELKTTSSKLLGVSSLHPRTQQLSCLKLQVATACYYLLFSNFKF